MQRLEVSGAVWPLYGSLGDKGLSNLTSQNDGQRRTSLQCLSVGKPRLRFKDIEGNQSAVV